MGQGLSGDLNLKTCFMLQEESKEDSRISDTQWKTLTLVHNDRVGHHGVERMLAKLQELREDWTHIREDARYFVQSCPCCQMMAKIKLPIETLNFSTAAYGVMDRICMDTIGPLP